LAIVDRQRELHLLHVTKRRCVKLAANVDCCCWHDTAPLLAAIVDGVLTVWFWPEVVWVDPELLQETRHEKREW
jgi:intraflagellar transport protein 80